LPGRVSREHFISAPLEQRFLVPQHAAVIVDAQNSFVFRGMGPHVGSPRHHD